MSDNPEIPKTAHDLLIAMDADKAYALGKSIGHAFAGFAESVNLRMMNDVDRNMAYFSFLMAALMKPEPKGDSE